MRRDAGNGGFAGTRTALYHHGLIEVCAMIRSCSAWMVATMSVILPVRLAFNDASSAPSPVSVPSEDA